MCEEETGDTTISEEPLITGFLQREVLYVWLKHSKFDLSYKPFYTCTKDIYNEGMVRSYLKDKVKDVGEFYTYCKSIPNVDRGRGQKVQKC